MKALEEKIVKEGKVYPGKILKVSSFLNHQLDVSFLTAMGKEFYELFKDERITKILTVETSGIAIAYPVAQAFGVPLLFAKKNKSANISGDCYSAKVTSFTHGHDYDVVVEKQFLQPGDRVLLIDDFLANGCALKGLLEICAQAGAEIAGAGIAIEKVFQDGGRNLRESGLRVESLARIADMDSEGGITFAV
ncbi:MAG: xanthine phosphoribosyltransferase [Lachnospiraceae bacterium]|jgi:xanthine phosphoribosyltransferase